MPPSDTAEAEADAEGNEESLTSQEDEIALFDAADCEFE